MFIHEFMIAQMQDTGQESMNHEISMLFFTAKLCIIFLKLSRFTGLMVRKTFAINIGKFATIVSGWFK